MQLKNVQIMYIFLIFEIGYVIVIM